MKKELSIIIPCYNVENYIVNCLDSIKKQLDNIKYEIILINDKSKDNTNNIINKYINNHKDMVITYINNEENIGAGASRNKAIKQAKYNYISFIDSDDYVSENFYEEMLNLIIKEKSDLVVCDISMVESGVTTRFSACPGKICKYNIISQGLAASPCNKIIKKELLLEYPFAEGIMNEDVASIIPIVANCNKVSYTDKVLYFYVQHEESVQNANLSDKKLNIIDAVKILEDRIKDNKDKEKYMDTVLFNQIIAFLFYVPTKEKRIITRGKFLTKFGNKSREFNLRLNKSYWHFLSTNSFKTRLYYKTYMKLVCNGFGILASLWIALYDFYKIFRKRNSVIKKDITIDDIKKAISKNQKSKSDKTVSVAIPNYNYSRFLYQRIYSIFNQGYKINELIFLDDCSKDDSREAFDDIEKNIKDIVKVKKIYNDVNSGSTFKQWQKAMKNCDSDYIWIAEADDYCNNKMLSSLMNVINKNEDIRIAYVDTAFINKDGIIILKTIKPEIDIMKTGHWDNDFVNNGVDEIKDYAFLNCTIANVSSVIFKNDDYSDIFDELGSYKQVGDYLFYLKVMEKGKIAFINKPLNYYRLHGNNVTSLTKKQLHFDELKRVHKLLDKKYKFNKKQKNEINKRYKFLEKVWDLK